MVEIELKLLDSSVLYLTATHVAPLGLEEIGLPMSYKHPINRDSKQLELGGIGLGLRHTEYAYYYKHVAPLGLWIGQDVQLGST